MSAVLEIPDGGTITVKIGSGAGIEMDVYEIYNQIFEIRDRQNDEDKPLWEFHAAVAELLVTKGLPRLSHYQADQFWTRLKFAVDALGKADGTVPTLVSQPSTVPESIPSPPA